MRPAIPPLRLALALACSSVGALAAGCTEGNPYLNVCGNGELEPANDEECDDGDANDDRGTCTRACKVASCGDGLVQSGVELCDEGADNDDLGPCTTRCEPPRCGDGIIQPPELCDDGDANKATADGDGGCSAACSPLARCGDGVVDSAWEECDDGNDVDSDACLSTCTLARCGDGVVQAGVEACDDGNDVDTDACLSTCDAARCGDAIVHEGAEACDDGNDIDTDACLSTCAAATCGDGVVWEGVEWCDDGNVDDSDGCNHFCHADRLVFVTEELWGPANFGALDGADVKCRLAAKEAGHDRWTTFRAWLSDGTASAADRMLHSKGRYVLSTGAVIADDWDDLTDGTLDHPIDRTALGLLVQDAVMTGTAPDGIAIADGHCMDWSASSDDLAIYGFSDELDEWWTYYDDGGGTCNGGGHLYCFEAW